MTTVYNLCKMLIDRGRTDGLQDKMDVYLAADRLTPEESGRQRSILWSKAGGCFQRLPGAPITVGVVCSPSLCAARLTFLPLPQPFALTIDPCGWAHSSALGADYNNIHKAPPDKKTVAGNHLQKSLGWISCC